MFFRILSFYFDLDLVDVFVLFNFGVFYLYECSVIGVLWNWVSG